MISKNSSLYPPNEVHIFQISFWSILLFPVFLRLPIGLGYRYMISIRFFTLVPILAVVFMQIMYIRRQRIPIPFFHKSYPLIMLFLLVWTIAIFRAFYIFNLFEAIFLLYDFVSFVIVILLIFFSFWLSPTDKAAMLRRGVFLSFGLYIILNMILYHLGIRPDYQFYFAEYPSQILSLFGISMNRTLFPMTDGINYYGLLSGAVFVASAFLCLDEKLIKWRIVFAFVAFISLVSILMTDSRGALLFLILTLLLVLLFGRFPKILILIVLAISILPVLATVFVPNLQSVRLDFLQRPDSNWVPAIEEKTYGNELCEELLAKSSGFLSNRPVIWKIVVKEASEPQIVHVIGYGHRGQVVSKLSERYSCLFKSYAFSNLASAHNLWLQTWIDIGYIGTLITIFFLYSLACRFSDLFITSHAYAFRSMYSVVVYIILIGSLEATISPDFNLLFILICAISVISIFEIRSHLDDFLK